MEFISAMLYRLEMLRNGPSAIMWSSDRLPETREWNWMVLPLARPPCFIHVLSRCIVHSSEAQRTIIIQDSWILWAWESLGSGFFRFVFVVGVYFFFCVVFCFFVFAFLLNKGVPLGFPGTSVHTSFPVLSRTDFVGLKKPIIMQ